MNALQFEMEIGRDTIMQDTIEKLQTGICKLPLKIWFRGEPGIDVGGLTREYFSLVQKELFASSMFLVNEDV